MTETTIKKDPFDFLFFYEFEDGREEDALLVGGDDPSTASPLHLAIGIKDAKQIVISPIPDVTRVSSSNYHFKLQFTPGILLQPEKITVEGDDWGLEVEGDTNLYLLWKGEEITLHDTNSLKLMLNGVMGTLTTRASQTNVTLSWEFKRDGITIIDVTVRAPGDTNPYNNTATETLEMIQRQGKANIPLYVGFFSSNRVLNTNNQESNLKLRITNTSESAITFNYDADETNRSQLVVALEVEPNNAQPESKVPWALGTVDQVNDVEVSIAGDKWQKTAGPDNKDGTLEWTFSPKSADFQLASKETLQVVLSKIVTAHPTGTANLYLRYKYVSGYQDGEFICPIEKAPLVFHDVKVSDKLEHRVGIGTTTPATLLNVTDYLTLGNPDNNQKFVIHSRAKSQGDFLQITNDTANGGWQWSQGITLKRGGHVGIGTTNPEAQLHVTETIQAKKIVADGAVFTGMILMWSGPASPIPDGWKLCDGQNGTPDLRDRFLVGAGSSKYPVGKTGGEEKVKLEIAHMPSHNHRVTDPGHDHSIEMRDSSSDVDPSSLPLYARNNITNENRKGTNRATTGISIQNAGDGQAHENLPPYYALCFIMKVALS